jgi:hypothetical protein
VKPDFFFESVKKIFNFLEKDYKFKTEEKYSGSILYTNDFIHINIWFDWHFSYEIDITFDLNDQNRRPFELRKLMLLKNDKDAEEFNVALFADRDNEVLNVLKKLSEKVKKYMPDIVNDKDIFRQLENQK